MGRATRHGTLVEVRCVGSVSAHSILAAQNRSNVQTGQQTILASGPVPPPSYGKGATLTEVKNLSCNGPPDRTGELLRYAARYLFSTRTALPAHCSAALARHGRGASRTSQHRAVTSCLVYPATDHPQQQPSASVCV